MGLYGKRGRFPSRPTGRLRERRLFSKKTRLQLERWAGRRAGKVESVDKHRQGAGKQEASRRTRWLYLQYTAKSNRAEATSTAPLPSHLTLSACSNRGAAAATGGTLPIGKHTVASAASRRMERLANIGANILAAALAFLITLSLIYQSRQEVSWSSSNGSHISLTFPSTRYICMYVHVHTL